MSLFSLVYPAKIESGTDKISPFYIQIISSILFLYSLRFSLSARLCFKIYPQMIVTHRSARCTGRAALVGILKRGGGRQSNTPGAMAQVLEVSVIFLCAYSWPRVVVLCCLTRTHLFCVSEFVFLQCYYNHVLPLMPRLEALPDFIARGGGTRRREATTAGWWRHRREEV